MSTPLVSIIIPAYNAEATIRQTLDSVAAATYPCVETIVVDDGSSDNTLSIARSWAAEHSECIVLHQPNRGVSAARNAAIRASRGEYILPVDADNTIEPDYVRLAAEVLSTRPEVKVVGCRADFFGDRTGEWHQPTFSYPLLARKNCIDTCSMYRRADYDRTTGYNESFPFREDWDFWLSMFETGGDFVRLDRILMHYRVRRDSKRISDRARKHELIDVINARHHHFIYRQLGGPLHYHRSWSRLINFFRRERSVGTMPLPAAGARIIYRGRNTLLEQDGVVIKRFARPAWWRQIIYGLFVRSKARRSYEYAQLLSGLTPAPVGYREVRYLGLLMQSEYACALSPCPHVFRQLRTTDFAHREDILAAIGRFTATLHRMGVIHRDYSEGNILFAEDGSRVEVVDLNRIRFYSHLSWTQRMQNFERLNIDRDALCAIIRAYASEMGDDAEQDCRYVLSHRWSKHVKQGITYLDEKIPRDNAGH